MAFSFPFRVAIWRRSQSEEGQPVSKLRLSIPAMLGALILVVAIPNVLSILSIESRPARNHATIGLLTECPSVIAEVLVSPSGGPEFVQMTVTDGFSVATREKASSFADTIRSNYYDSVVMIRLYPALFNEPGCNDLLVDVGNTHGTTPTLVDSIGGTVSLEKSFDDDGNESTFGALFRVAFDENEVEAGGPYPFLVFDWPGFFAYSHQNSNILFRAIEDFSSSANVHIYWGHPNLIDDIAANDDEYLSPAMNLTLSMAHPPSFSFMRSTWEPSEVRQDEVTYKIDTWDETNEGVWVDEGQVPFLTTKNIYRSTNFEGKQNFILLVGGALIGLGVTLIVETMIAFLFRVGDRTKLVPDFATSGGQHGVGDPAGAGDSVLHTNSSIDISDSSSDDSTDKDDNNDRDTKDKA